MGGERGRHREGVEERPKEGQEEEKKRGRRRRIVDEERGQIKMY